MADKIVVLQPEILVITVAAFPIKALPATGTILGIEPARADATAFDGLHATGAVVMTRGRRYNLTLNVLPNSEEDAWLSATRKTQLAAGLLFPFSATYKLTSYVSASAFITGPAVRNFTGDSVEVSSWPIGAFMLLDDVAPLVAPSTLERGDIEANLVG